VKEEEKSMKAKRKVALAHVSQCWSWPRLSGTSLKDLQEAMHHPYSVLPVQETLLEAHGIGRLKDPSPVQKSHPMTTLEEGQEKIVALGTSLPRYGAVTA
jgi:hypothetical protein